MILKLNFRVEIILLIIILILMVCAPMLLSCTNHSPYKLLEGFVEGFVENKIILYYDTDNIKVLDNVLTEEECENIKSLQEEYGKKKINIPDISKKIEERCKRYILDKLYISYSQFLI
jgi:hypothetical protein